MRNYSFQKTADFEISIPVTKVLLVALFLLPITILANKGLNSGLPLDGEKSAKTDVLERNVYRICINENGYILAETTPFIPFDVLQAELREFILNDSKNPELPDSPEDAIISFQMDIGTKYERFVEVLEIVEAVYIAIYAERVGMTSQQYCELDLDNPEKKLLYDLGKKGIPMNISIKQPNIP